MSRRLLLVSAIAAVLVALPAVALAANGPGNGRSDAPATAAADDGGAQHGNGYRNGPGDGTGTGFAPSDGTGNTYGSRNGDGTGVCLLEAPTVPTALFAD